jgi:hypothetical protein
MTNVERARTRRPRSERVPEAHIKRLGRAKALMGLAVAIGTLLGSAAPAFAEFESKNGSSNQGKGEIYQAVVEGGGARITCESPEEEASSKVGWTVENQEGKTQKKGTNLEIKAANWGKCQTKASALKEAQTKLSACEMEVKQAEEESKIPVKIAKACTIKVSGCEIKIGSQEPKALEVATGGGDAENTRLILALSGIAWEVNSECASLGIEASKAVSIVGTGELDSVEESVPEYQSKGGKFTDKQTKIILGGEKETESVGSINCEEAAYTLGSKGRSTTLPVTPELLKCKAVFGKEAPKTVKVSNECKEGLQLDQPERFEEEEGPGLYRSKITLLKGCKVTLEAAACTIKIAGEGEALPWAYYTSLDEMTLEEPETIFEVAGIHYTAGEGCKAGGVPASGNAQAQGGRGPGFRSPGGYNFFAELKSEEPVLPNAKSIQEFSIPNGEMRMVCTNAVYKSSVEVRGEIHRLRLKPSFLEGANGTCSLTELASAPAAVTVALNNCEFVLSALRGSGSVHKGNFAIDGTGCTGISFTSNICSFRLLPIGSLREVVEYINTEVVAPGKMEVHFTVPGFQVRKINGCDRVAIAVNMRYIGEMFLEKLIIAP